MSLKLVNVRASVTRLACSVEMLGVGKGSAMSHPLIITLSSAACLASERINSR